jgi:hypothetical protein
VLSSPFLPDVRKLLPIRAGLMRLQRSVNLDFMGQNPYAQLNACAVLDSRGRAQSRNRSTSLEYKII